MRKSLKKISAFFYSIMGRQKKKSAFPDTVLQTYSHQFCTDMAYLLGNLLFTLC